MKSPLFDFPLPVELILRISDFLAFEQVAGLGSVPLWFLDEMAERGNGPAPHRIQDCDSASLLHYFMARHPDRLYASSILEGLVLRGNLDLIRILDIDRILASRSKEQVNHLRNVVEACANPALTGFLLGSALYARCSVDSLAKLGLLHTIKTITAACFPTTAAALDTSFALGNLACLPETSMDTNLGNSACLPETSMETTNSNSARFPEITDTTIANSARFPDITDTTIASSVRLPENAIENPSTTQTSNAVRFPASAQAINNASKGGFLELVQFLHYNRSEGATSDAIDWASKYGHQDVVLFLLENGYPCSQRALEYAARKGHRTIVSALLEFDKQRMVTGGRRRFRLDRAMELAKLEGHADIFNRLRDEEIAAVDPDALQDRAARDSVVN
ncbi:MAG: hypothetical protein SGCHY_004487 [Lobulomycetales sp.]